MFAHENQPRREALPATGSIASPMIGRKDCLSNEVIVIGRQFAFIRRGMIARSWQSFKYQNVFASQGSVPNN